MIVLYGLLFFMEGLEAYFDKDFLEVGEEVLTYEYIESLREDDSDYTIVAQRGSQELFLSTDADILIFGGKRGGPLPVDTKVVTPFGYRRIGDLEAGDIISATDGGMQKVLYRKDHGKLPSYKLTFIDGSSIIASYDHLWNIRRTCYTSKKRTLNNLDLEDDWRVWTTEMIVEHLKKEKNGEIKKGHIIIPLCNPIKFTIGLGRGYKPQIDPYLLGVLIGDGCITDIFMKHDKIMFTTVDKEIVDSFIDAGYDVQLRSVCKNTDYVFKDTEFVEGLRYLGLAGCKPENKFIPRLFKFGTIEERLALLQGLMDTDGTIDKRGHCSYTTISKQLAEDVKFLVGSLGGIATIKHYPTYYKKDGIKIPCNGAYTIYIKFPDSYKLFRLKRKRELSKKFNGGISEYARRIVDFEYVGEKDCCCIAVDNKNSLFMAEDFIVTHNSKSFSLLLETLYDIDNPNFSGCILRKEKEDSRKAGGLIDKSDPIYNQFGVYNRGQNDMTWNFSAGGRLKFDYYSDTFEEFTRRFRGQELAYIGVDEITHMKYAYFKFLLTSNRNAYHIKNRFVGTCNPDPDSWVANFIDWWLDKDGYPIPERNGVIRYCFMPGDDISDIYWGNTKQEVYEKAKHLIDRRWKKEYEIFGTKEDMFIKSVTFIEGKLEENIKLLKSDPNYLANLANQSEEQVSRDLDGNWKFKTAGLELISFNDMNSMFNNSYQIGSTRCVTCDPAYDGGDKCVLWYWEGFHAKDLQVITLDPQRTEDYIREFLKLHNVLEDNFCYDLPGVGQVLRKMKNARPFSPKAMPTDGSRSKFENLKSECAYKFVERIKNRGYSIEPSILDMKFSGKGYKNLTVREILLKERKAIARCDKDLDKNWKLISKPEMKQIVGHSPDFVESLIIREYFEMVKPKKRREGLYYL